MAPKVDFYYGGNGQKILLRTSDDTLVIAYRQSAPAKYLEKLIRSDNRLARFIVSPELQKRGLVLYKRSPSASVPVDQFIARLARSPLIRYVIPIYFRGDTPVIISDEFNAAFKTDVERTVIDKFNNTHGVRVLESFNFAPNTFLLQVKNPASNRTLEVAKQYFESGLVTYAEPNFIKVMALKLVPNDPLYPQQWHLPRIRAEEAWDITQGDPATIIAIIDDGVDIAHEDFASAGKITAGQDFLSGDADPNPGPGDNHGTAVAGVATADGNNGIGVSGIAPGCRLMPIRLVGNAQTDAMEAQAFRHAADNGAAVISNSWGPTDGAGAAPLAGIVRAAIDHATSNGRAGLGCVVLFAAGNGNESISAPATLDGYASYDRVIAVAANNDQNVRSGYSDFGPEVDVCAPSDGTSAFPDAWAGMPADGSTLGIFTTDRMGNVGYNPPAPPNVDPAGAAVNYTGTFGGTSSAAPLAAGVAALMLSIAPDLTREQVQYVLEATADKIDAANTDPVGSYQATGHSQWYGYGRIHALDAVRGSRSSVPERDFVHSVRIRLRRTSGDRFVSESLIQTVDARQRPVDTAARIFIRGGPDGFLRTELNTQADEVDVDR